jgi:hypothetical protein
MADRNELVSLKASLRGAIGASDALREILARIDALPPEGEPAAEDLDALSRLSAAHAIAAAALRGLVKTMLERRGLLPAPQGAAGSGTAGIEE